MSKNPMETSESPIDYAMWGIKERQDVHSGEQLRLLTTKLKQVIKQESKMVKEKENEILDPAPISYHIPIDYNYSIPLNPQFDPSVPQEKKEEKRAKATLVGRYNTSFKLSDDIIAQAMKYEEEKLRNSQHQNQNQKACQYSLYERLEGWRIDRKRRPNGTTFDIFFEHEKSKGKFRSVAEVISFILHEAYPKRQPNATQGKEENPQVPPGYEEPEKYPIPEHLGGPSSMAKSVI
ncbi:Uncharacterized protein TCM_025359 [Theobroma cacao]|uniref:MBD domain-containing protein n=1 Tax=Theobroma cacao TaxID=3641 RepID=A0A061EY13_THECC|nr:Uncharacterized protein TCM_025359 [Theobroma cacao]